jgi:hypothetical protein
VETLVFCLFQIKINDAGIELDFGSDSGGCLTLHCEQVVSLAPSFPPELPAETTVLKCSCGGGGDLSASLPAASGAVGDSGSADAARSRVFQWCRCRWEAQCTRIMPEQVGNFGIREFSMHVRDSPVLALDVVALHFKQTDWGMDYLHCQCFQRNLVFYFPRCFLYASFFSSFP